MISGGKKILNSLKFASSSKNNLETTYNKTFKSVYEYVFNEILFFALLTL